MLGAIDSVLAKGHQLMARGSQTNLLPMEPFAEFRGGCLHIVGMLGRKAEIWRPVFEDQAGFVRTGAAMVGTLTAIRRAVESDLLLSVEDLVFADAFGSLLEQADYLFAGGYSLAAGVLGRAVLEEHLRRLCQKHGCLPTKLKPTLADFRIALSQSGQINNIERAHLEAMTAIGNAAAHNMPIHSAADTERMLSDVREFLLRHPT